MKPILFPKTATQFNTNGLGRLDFISCQVTEERNGIYELEGTIAETANHAKQIETESIIVAKPSQGGSLQAFRVYKITKPIGGQFMVFARHISYQLGFITAMPFSVALSPGACPTALQGFITNAAGYTAQDFPFSFWTDVNTASSYNQKEPATIRSRLGGVEGSILDQFGGEYEWDNFQIKLHKKRGLTIPQVTLRYGKNITDLQQEENIENTVTGIVPFWTDAEGGDIVTLPEKIIEVQNASSFPFKKTIPYDFSQAFETKPTESQLRSKAQAYVSSSDIGVPKVSIKLSFINLADTEEFKEIAPLQSVNLCDEINVQFEKLGINTTAEIVKTEYDVLREKYNSIEVGSLRSSLAKVISGNMEDIDGIGTTTKEIIKKNNDGIDDKIDDAVEAAVSGLDFPTTQEVGQMIDDATTWLTSGDGYVVAVKDPVTHEWQALLFMDSPDIENAHNVLKVNTAGIGFSRNGVNGPYTQAWTLDGRLIVGGTNVPSFTVYDANNNVIFQTTAAGTIWNSTNSSMTQNGTLTIKNATISGGTLSVLKPNWRPQTPGDQPTDDDYLFKVNASGLLWNLTNSKMDANGTLQITGATINGGTLEIKSGNTTIFKVNSSGIIWNLPNSTMAANGAAEFTDLEINNCTIDGNAQFGATSGAFYIDIIDGENIQFNDGENILGNINQSLPEVTVYDSGGGQDTINIRQIVIEGSDKIKLGSGSKDIGTGDYAAQIVIQTYEEHEGADDNNKIKLEAESVEVNADHFRVGTVEGITGDIIANGHTYQFYKGILFRII